MKVRIIAKNDTGKEAIKKLYDSRTIMLRMIQGHAQIITEEPFELEIQHKQWTGISAAMLNSNKHIKRSVEAPMESILSDLGAAEGDYEIKCI